MLRKTVIALMATAAVAMLMPDIASAQRGFGGGRGGGFAGGAAMGGGGGFRGAAIGGGGGFRGAAGAFIRAMAGACVRFRFASDRHAAGISLDSIDVMFDRMPSPQLGADRTSNAAS